MTPLEGRYRRLLHLLPAGYRDAWEEDMTATFLQAVRTGEAERDEHLDLWGRPPAAEVVSVAALALRLRLGGAEAPARSFVWGQAVRLVALVGPLFQALVATIGALQEAWLAGWLPWPPVPEAIAGLGVRSGASPELAQSVAPLLWVAAFLALVLGRRRAARWLGVAAVVPLVLGAAEASGAALLGQAPVPAILSRWGDVAFSALPVVALLAFHGEASPVRPRPWALAFAGGVALAPLPGLLLLAQPVAGLLILDWPGLAAIGVVAAGAVHLGRTAHPEGATGTAWALALAILAAAVLVLRTASLLNLALNPGAGASAATLAIGLIEGVALLGVGAPLVAQARRTLPPPPLEAGPRSPLP